MHFGEFIYYFKMVCSNDSPWVEGKGVLLAQSKNGRIPPIQKSMGYFLAQSKNGRIKNGHRKYLKTKKNEGRNYTPPNINLLKFL